MFRNGTPSEMLRAKALLRNADNGAGTGGAAGETPAAEKPTVRQGEGQAQQPGVTKTSGSGETPASGDDEAYDKDRAMETIRKLRAELKDVTGKAKRVKELEDAEQERERAKLSEIERATQDAQTAQTKLQAAEQRLAEMENAHKETVLRYEVELQATAMGIIDPEAAVKLLDWNMLEFDEQGAPKNVEQVLKKLVGAKPYLVKAASGSAGLGTPAGKPKTPQPAEGNKDEFEALVRRQIIR